MTFFAFSLRCCEVLTAILTLSNITLLYLEIMARFPPGDVNTVLHDYFLVLVPPANQSLPPQTGRPPSNYAMSSRNL